MNATNAIIGCLVYLYFDYWKYTFPSTLLALLLVALWAYLNQPHHPLYRDPFPEKMREQEQGEHLIRRNAFLAKAWSLGVGVGIGLALASGFFFGEWTAHQPELFSTTTEEPPLRRPPRPCLCREAVLVTVVYKTSCLGSPLEPWPHLVLQEVWVSDVVDIGCN